MRTLNKKQVVNGDLTLSRHHRMLSRSAVPTCPLQSRYRRYPFQSRSYGGPVDITLVMERWTCERDYETICVYYLHIPPMEF